jgi:hypothetical protein
VGVEGAEKKCLGAGGADDVWRKLLLLNEL